MLDLNGLLRRPSVTGVQALSLYNQLLHMTDQRDRAGDQWMQSESFSTFLVLNTPICIPKTPLGTRRYYTAWHMLTMLQLDQMMHTNVIEQMRMCDLMWESPGEISMRSSEVLQSMEQIRIKQRLAKLFLCSNLVRSADEDR